VKSSAPLVQLLFTTKKEFNSIFEAPKMNNLGILNLSELSWDEAMELLELVHSDGWEILAIKLLPEGVLAFVQERIVEWLDERL